MNEPPPVKTSRRQWLRGFWGFALASTIIVLAVVFLLPRFSPTLRVAGNTLALSLACPPKRITVDVATPYARLESVNATVNLPRSQPGRPVDYPLTVESETAVQNKGTASAVDQNLKQKLGAASKLAPTRVLLTFNELPSVDIKRLQVEFLDPPMDSESCPQPLTLNAEDIPGKAQESMVGVPPFLLIQEPLGYLIYKLNELVGNLVLFAMLASLVWLAFQLWLGLQRAFRPSPDERKHRIDQLAEEWAERAPGETSLAMLRAEFAVHKRRLSFAATMGPALGFMLTVAALVAALHPAAQARTDAFEFVRSLQLALISTFVGIAMRVTADFATRAYQRALDQDTVLIVEDARKQSGVANLAGTLPEPTA